MKIDFMGELYASQKSFTEYINERLCSVSLGLIEQGDDFEFMHALYKRHPCYNSNIDAFHVVQLDKGQELNRVYNGQYDIFSKHTCIRQKLKSEEHHAKALARELIVEQIKIARKTLGDTCELCPSKSNLEIDHYPVLFCKILNDFGPLDIKFNIKYDVPIEQSNRWKLYHQMNAKYRLLCASCNKTEYIKNKK
jgi:hypothetical protein